MSWESAEEEVELGRAPFVAWVTTISESELARTCRDRESPYASFKLLDDDGMGESLDSSILENCNFGRPVTFFLEK